MICEENPLKYSLMTDKGIVRKNNQDCCYAACPDASSCFAVVCDGMGGSNAGEVASEMAVKIISERLTSSWRNNITPESVVNLLTTAITAANICVFDKSFDAPEYEGMGTTVAVVVITAGRLIAAHAGDSRVYLADKELRCLTKDHSLVQDMIDSGELTEEQARVHPKKNYITRALGVEEKIDIDFTECAFQPNNKILLCSDGLSNSLTPEQISGILRSGEPTEKLAAALVDAANENGGSDNITAVVISE